MQMTEMQELFLQQQNELVSRIHAADTFDLGSLKYIAGVDLAYWEHNGEEYAVCCIVLIDFETQESRIPIPTRFADLETHIAREAEKTNKIRKMRSRTNLCKGISVNELELSRNVQSENTQNL